jgi:hypothetical protein
MREVCDNYARPSSHLPKVSEPEPPVTRRRSFSGLRLLRIPILVAKEPGNVPSVPGFIPLLRYRSAAACDCGTWAQQMMLAGGLQSGAPAPVPAYLIEQLNQIYNPW